jgi:hypothetical protein
MHFLHLFYYDIKSNWLLSSRDEDKSMITPRPIAARLMAGLAA